MFNLKDVYKGNLEWLPRRALFVCKAGSQAYGTSGPDSDLDLRGVFLAPKEYTLGFLNRIEQVDKGFTEDACLYELKRFLSLAVDCNPNVIELAFTDPEDWLHVTAPWRTVLSARDNLLSTNAKHRFCGYAVSQLKRIETHRRWLLHPPDHKPTRAEYGLPEHSAVPKEQREALEAVMKKIVEEWQVDLACLDDATRIDFMNKQAEAMADMKLAADDQYVAAANKLGLDVQAMEWLKSERAYRGALNEWKQYQDWVENRNAARAELERKYGYDTKHGMHLVRLMRMAREILEDKGVIVRRPDAEELRAIRFHGAWSYEQLVEWGRRQDAELTELMKTSPLPKQPRRMILDVVCQAIVESYLHRDPEPEHL